MQKQANDHAQELKARCNPLRPLPDCDGLGVEMLGKQSQCSTVSSKPDLDSMKMTFMDRIASGRCEASTSGLCRRSIRHLRCSKSDLETSIVQKR